MRWGIVDGSGRVVAIVDSDARPASSYRIPAGVAVQVGWSWTGWEFRSPRWTSYEFLRRFSSGEREAIRVAAAALFGYDGAARAEHPPASRKKIQKPH